MSQSPNFIEYSIALAIRERPEEAAADMLRMMRREAKLEAEILKLLECITWLERCRRQQF